MTEFGNISTGKDATPTRTVVKLPVLFRRINLEVARPANGRAAEAMGNNESRLIRAARIASAGGYCVSTCAGM
jgi:hypothetical protein